MHGVLRISVPDHGFHSVRENLRAVNCQKKNGGDLTRKKEQTFDQNCLSTSLVFCRCPTWSCWRVSGDDSFFFSLPPICLLSPPSFSHSRYHESTPFKQIAPITEISGNFIRRGFSTKVGNYGTIGFCETDDRFSNSPVFLVVPKRLLLCIYFRMDFSFRSKSISDYNARWSQLVEEALRYTCTSKKDINPRFSCFFLGEGG